MGNDVTLNVGQLRIIMREIIVRNRFYCIGFFIFFVIVLFLAKPLYASDYYGVSVDDIADTVEFASKHDNYEETRYDYFSDSEGWLDDSYISKQLLETRINYYSTGFDGLDITLGDILLPLYVKYKIAITLSSSGKKVDLLKVLSDQK